ncbi:MAG: hypothetical protein Q4P15_08600 [Propionibacteriaceae bacterium]|nr:hypothetical protein [Propionibacteriaceae bacterium]
MTIRGYYFPWFGARKLPLSAIRIVTRVPLSTWGGRWRLWGSTTLEYWANIDMRRHRKNTGFALDIGYSMKPFITPDDPDGFERVLRSAVPSVPFIVKPDPLSAV